MADSKDKESETEFTSARLRFHQRPRVYLGQCLCYGLEGDILEFLYTSFCRYQRCHLPSRFRESISSEEANFSLTGGSHRLSLPKTWTQLPGITSTIWFEELVGGISCPLTEQKHVRELVTWTSRLRRGGGLILSSKHLTPRYTLTWTSMWQSCSCRSRVPREMEHGIFKTLFQKVNYGVLERWFSG